MIAGILIVGFFALSIAGLYVLGRRVENPADLEITLDDWNAMMRNRFVIAGRQLAAQIRVVGDAFAAINEAGR